MNDRDCKKMTIDKKEQWETVIDFTAIKKGGISLDEVIKSLFRIRDYENNLQK